MAPWQKELFVQGFQELAQLRRRENRFLQVSPIYLDQYIQRIRWVWGQLAV